MRYSHSTFESLVNANLDYLICLHNDQVAQLNDHTSALNNRQIELASLDSNIARVAQLTIRMSNAIDRLETENADLKSIVESLTSRIEALEAAK
jgi:archaellum component FlaC